MRKAQIGTGLCSAALGAFALVEGADLDMFGEHGEPGPGFFPDLSAAALLVLGVLLVAVNVLHRPAAKAAAAGAAGDPAEGGGAADAGDGFEPRRLLRAGRVWAGFTAAVALLQLLGFLAAMGLLVAYLLFTVERIRVLRAVLAIVLIPLAVYGVFAYLLGVELPTGSLFGDS
ncbi:tripartite tricarboxylate transporter TctB family protein [Streptomyces sp. NPDC050560]|uniref:tripartite tricarboxylate transporter TctB family protein n=1 Tax=Streptomyces sp. NPDC050560 TaxID=3365630 RepID=UPI0037AC2079